jgi:taurine dioxygenase
MLIEPLTCAIGAELIGVDLAEAAHDDELFARVRAALLRYRVLFLRDQQISRADHAAFASRFGELEDHPVAPSHPDHPGLVLIYKNPESPVDRYENAWHTDATWREAPPMGCVLRCVECPPVGGDTMWANMALAYERLSDEIKTKIANLHASHSIEASFGAAMPTEKRLALKAQYPDAEHPVVRTHPETGRKALYLNPNRMEQVVGLDRAESDALLDALTVHATQPEYQYRHKWRRGDILIWDNRCTMHKANADYPAGSRRFMHRLILEGTVPV